MLNFDFTNGDNSRQHEYMIDVNRPHFISVCAHCTSQVRVFLSSIVTWAMTNSNNFELSGEKVDISMRDVGDEIIDDDSLKVVKAVESQYKMVKYNYLEALNNSTNVPTEASLLITTNDRYCGRLHLYDYSINKNFSSDSAIIIVESQEDRERVLEFLSNDSNKDAYIVFAVVSQRVYVNDDGAERKLIEYLPDIKEKLKGRKYVSFWYNPYGFVEKDTLRTADDPKPVGVCNIFWKSVEMAAENRLKKDSKIVEECQQVIATRRSVYQIHSERRQLHLNMARREYARCVVRMYSSDNLFALCKGTLSGSSSTASSN